MNARWGLLSPVAFGCRGSLRPLDAAPMLSESDLRGLTQEAETIAREAGALLLEGWRKRPAVREKEVSDLVTDFDLRSEELIRGRLASLDPAIVVVGEELENEG